MSHSILKIIIVNYLYLALLKGADLSKTSSKKIRQELEKKLKTDLGDR